MGILITLTVGLMLWIVGWSLGFSSFWGFVYLILVLGVAFTLRMVSPFVKSQIGR